MKIVLQNPGFGCLDLDRRFGDQLRIANEPGLPFKPKARDPWLREIRCRHGRIYPMGPETLAAWTGTTRHAKCLLRVPGVRRHQVGDAEATVIFELDSRTQEEIFRLLKPRRRRRIRSPRLLEALEAGRRRLNGSVFKTQETEEPAAPLAEVPAGKDRAEPHAVLGVIKEPSSDP